MPSLRRLSSHLLPLGLLAAGCGGGGDGTPDAPTSIDADVPDAMPNLTIMENLLLEPNEVTEGIMTGGSGDIALIRLTAPAAAIEWNLHSHPTGSTVVIHEEYDKASVEYTFAPTAESDWYLLIRNGGATDMTISVKVDIFGDMTWRWE